MKFLASKPRLHVLTKRSDFTKIFKTGHRVRPSGWLLVNFIENDLGYLRCGWTLPRNVGNAVTRNRLKRWCRAYFRTQMPANVPAIDLNLVFRAQKSSAKSSTSGEGFYKSLDYAQFTETLEKAWALIEKRI